MSVLFFIYFFVSTLFLRGSKTCRTNNFCAVKKSYPDRNFHLNIFWLSVCCRKTTIVITSVEILATLLPQPPPPYSPTPTTTFNVNSRTDKSHPSSTVMCPLNAGWPLNRSHNFMLIGYNSSVQNWEAANGRKKKVKPRAGGGGRRRSWRSRNEQ